MVDADIPLDNVIRLSVPFPWGFIRLHVIAQRQLPEAAVQTVRVMDNNFCPDFFTVWIAFGKDSSNILLLNIVFADIACLVGHNNGFPFITLQAGRIKDFLRKSQFPADRAVLVLILKNPGGCYDRMVNEIPFFCKIGFIYRDTVKPEF